MNFFLVILSFILGWLALAALLCFIVSNYLQTCIDRDVSDERAELVLELVDSLEILFHQLL